jgi:gliding motility-associated-like protein
MPTVDAGPNQTLVSGSSAQLHATGDNIHTYSWSPSSSLSCESCSSPVATMSVTTTYVVKVTTDYGCLAEDSVKIFLYCDNSQVFVPNSFTPNGDGQNDVFYPRGGGISNIKSFRIYNRWGQLLFERSDIPLNDESNAWDGSYGGGSPRPDVYVYIIDAYCSSGQPIFIKGDVTIIR